MYALIILHDGNLSVDICTHSHGRYYNDYYLLLLAPFIYAYIRYAHCITYVRQQKSTCCARWRKTNRQNHTIHSFTNCHHFNQTVIGTLQELVTHASAISAYREFIASKTKHCYTAVVALYRLLRSMPVVMHYRFPDLERLGYYVVSLPVARSQLGAWTASLQDAMRMNERNVSQFFSCCLRVHLTAGCR